MLRSLPFTYRQHLEGRNQALLADPGSQRLTMRAFWVGGFLSFFLAVGAPYGKMIIRGSFMALDFSTPGAIFLFLVLIGILNVLFKCMAGPRGAVLGALALTAYFGWFYSDASTWDPYAPGFIFAQFMLASSWLNVWLVGRGQSLVLNRAELILVYVMLLIVSALCTMGLSEQILPMLTAVFYYATPENKWRELLFPHFSQRTILVDDGRESKTFYEGLAPGETIPYGSWLEPLCWWSLFLLALYLAMVSIAVIIRRQWMERERLPYPLTQVGLAMIRGEEAGCKVNNYFRQGWMWAGFSLPMFFGSLEALHRYNSVFPVVNLAWNVPLVGKQILQLSISFAVVGFSYFINANIAVGIWFFHLWLGRGHYIEVFNKAVGRAPEVDDGDEIMSYRWAVCGLAGGILIMSVWLWVMGTPAWVALVFIIVALLIFIGITRIIAEAGLAVVRAPMPAPDLVIMGLGSELVGPTGVWNLSLAYMWAADVRVFVLATCTNGLKLIQEMEPGLRRVVFWAILLALLIGSLGSFWMIFHMAYQNGGINLNNWFFKGAPETAYNNALRNIDPAGVYWTGWAFFTSGGMSMALMMWARQKLPWWPVHPIGFPIGANSMMNSVWFSVFLAWALKKVVLRFGGVSLYRRSQVFFLGMICGQMSCNGIWLVIDYFTGKVGNNIFWI